jgi:hypothetical protein
MELDVLKVILIYGAVFCVPEYSTISKFWEERGGGIYCFK